MKIIPPNRIVSSDVGRLFGEVKSLFTKLYFLSSHSFPVRLRRRGNYAFRSTNHHRFVDYSSEPNSLLRCRKTIRRREFHFCNNTTDTYFLSIKLSRLIMQIIPPNRIVSSVVGRLFGEGSMRRRESLFTKLYLHLLNPIFQFLS